MKTRAHVVLILLMPRNKRSIACEHTSCMYATQSISVSAKCNVSEQVVSLAAFGPWAFHLVFTRSSPFTTTVHSHPD